MITQSKLLPSYSKELGFRVIINAVIKILSFLLSQNGIVTKDLTRLKMLFSEIEVSASGCMAEHLPVSFVFYIWILVLAGFTGD